MSGVPIVWVCLGNFWGASAHAFIPKMKNSTIRPCWENGNDLKWVTNYRYFPLFSTITMNSNNAKILAPIPSQCTHLAPRLLILQSFRTFPTWRVATTTTTWIDEKHTMEKKLFPISSNARPVPPSPPPFHLPLCKNANCMRVYSEW